MAKAYRKSLITFAAAMQLPLWGCSSDSDSTPQTYGSVAIPLVTKSSASRVFVLCGGVFRITSTSSDQTWSIDAGDHTSEPSVVQSLPVGNYEMGLLDWSMCEEASDGLHPVAASLASPIRSFYISAMQTTYVEYTFMVGDLAVAFGGQLSIRLNVYEGMGTGGAAGAPGWNGDYASLYGACVLACGNERQTARYLDPNGGAELSCAQANGSSCSTYCSYEASRFYSGSWYDRMGRYYYGPSSCADAIYRYNICAATGAWSCVAGPSGAMRSQPPAGCSIPQSCGGSGTAGASGY